MNLNFIYDYYKKIFKPVSHDDITSFNNLDFWKSHSSKEFGLIYEVYDKKI